MVFRLTWRLTQLAAGAAFVTVSVHYGVWGTTYNGSEVVETIRTKVLPKANQYLVQFPSKDEVKTTCIKTWNGGVQKVFSGMLMAPDVVCDYSKKAFTEVQSYING